MNTNILQSTLDDSVNFTEKALTGFLESRYVRKEPKYFMCYLSSQTGCNKGCKMCHLTATKQTKFVDTTLEEFLQQAEKVFQHYDRLKQPAEYVHFNFMARGEPLANQVILNNSEELFYNLGGLAHKFDPNLGVKFNISTIFPRDLTITLNKIFKVIHPTIYYSLYSCSPEFRTNWMPSAKNYLESFEDLKSYQEFSRKILKIHYAFIKDRNDSIKDLDEIISTIKKFDLKCDFNLVRYNPYSIKEGEESSEETIERNLDHLISHFPGKVKVIPRVGFDVKASCGMFIQGNDHED